MPAKTAFEKAVAKIDFSLGYQTVERTLHQESIEGPRLDNSYKPGTNSVDGSWSLGTARRAAPRTEIDWIREFFTGALGEAIHEALEWYKVKDYALMDPHDVRYEDEIFDLVQQFSDDLWNMIKDPRIKT